MDAGALRFEAGSRGDEARTLTNLVVQGFERRGKPIAHHLVGFRLDSLSELGARRVESSAVLRCHQGSQGALALPERRASLSERGDGFFGSMDDLAEGLRTGADRLDQLFAKGFRPIRLGARFLLWRCLLGVERWSLALWYFLCRGRLLSFAASAAISHHESTRSQNEGQTQPSGGIAGRSLRHREEPESQREERDRWNPGRTARPLPIIAASVPRKLA